MRIFYCDIHYACFGFISKDGIVKEAAPIFAWAIGKSLSEIKPFLLSKKAKVIEL